jgi:hypothetical protein
MRENTDHGLERRRKEAKRLLRDLRVGDEDAAARVGAVLGARAAKRFVLADAQHVIAVEHGVQIMGSRRRGVDEHQPVRGRVRPGG